MFDIWIEIEEVGTWYEPGGRYETVEEIHMKRFATLEEAQAYVSEVTGCHSS